MKLTTLKLSPALWIAAVYVIITALWILFSDQMLHLLVLDHDRAVMIGTYKGWGFAILTGILLYLMLSRAFGRYEALQARQQVTRQALLHASRHYRALARLSPAGLFYADVQGKILSVSPRYRGITGLSKRQAQGDGWLSAVHPADRQSVLANFDRNREGTGIGHIEYRLVGHNEKTVWVQQQMLPQFDAAGDLAGFVGTILDITDSKRAEEQIRYQAGLIELISDAIISADADYRVVSWNKAAEKMYGWSAAEVIGTQIELEFKSEVPGQDYQAMLPLFLEQGHWEAEVIQSRKDGTRIPVLASWVLIKDDQGRPIGSVGIHRDITDRKRAEAALRDSEELYRTVFESAAIGIALSESDGTPIIINRALQDMLGTTLSDIKSRPNPWETYYEPNDLQRLQETAQTKGKIENAEVRITREDGAFRYMLLSVIPVTYKGRSCWHTIMQDITDRKRAEGALRESEELYRTVFESSTIGIVLSEGDSTPIVVNQAFEEITQYRLSEMKQFQNRQGLYDNPDDLQRLRALIASQGKIENTEIKIKRKDGTSRYTQLAVRPVTYKGRSCWHTIMQDITERKRAEEALRESEERYRRLAERAPDIVFRWSKVGGFEYISSSAVAITGYTPAEFYADRDLPSRMAVEEDLVAVQDYFSGVFRGELPAKPMTIRLIRKDRQIVYTEIRVSPVYDEQGKLLAVEGIARDVTQQHIDRARLRELTQRVTTAQEEERRRVAAELHEEVGQLLTVARMRLGLIVSQLTRRSKKIQKQFDGLNALLEESLQMVRGLSHELRPPLLDEMGWQPALEWLCESFARRTGIAVSYHHRGKRDRLSPPIELAAYRVVQEALTNAVRHAQASAVEVITNFTRKGLTVTIRDNGRGFDVESVRRAHQPGVGLGLLSMQERVSTVDGSLEIASRPGRGTGVQVRFPVRGRG